MDDIEKHSMIIPKRTNRKFHRPRALTKRNVGFVAALFTVAIGLSVYFAVSTRTNGTNTSFSGIDDRDSSSAAAKSPTSSPRIRAPALSPTVSAPAPTDAPAVDGSNRNPVSLPTESPTALPTTSVSTSEPTVAQTTAGDPFTDFVATSNADVTLHDGTALDGTIPYYHCSGGGDSISHIVLLHGASFTRDNWKRSGALDMFCEWENVAVTAVDLPVSAKRDDLARLLEALPTDLEAVSPNLPKDKVAALVSPSASGSTVIDWLISDEVDELHSWVQTWVPVACGSVLLADETVLQAGLTTSLWPILAIHGDEDSSRSSDKLKELAPQTTTVVELPGPHAVYLHSQQDFVTTVLDYIAENRREHADGKNPNVHVDVANRRAIVDDTKPTVNDDVWTRL